MKNKDPIKLKSSSFRVPKKKMKGIPLEKYQWDISVPNTNINKEIKKIKKIKNDIEGLYLSDLIRYICNKNPNKHITLIVSSCRSFYDDLPNNVIKNQKKISTVSTDEYIKKYVDEDVN